VGQPSYSAAELAERFGLELQGDGAVRVHGVGTLARAQAGQLAFLANSKYRSQLVESQASVITMRAEDATGHTGTVLVARDPYAAFARMSALFEPRRCAPRASTHPPTSPPTHMSTPAPTWAHSSASVRAAAWKRGP
jgi:UDP-3-O-[3-hydroxymyristoyl] glucosamine N-acyltransferase